MTTLKQKFILFFSIIFIVSLALLGIISYRGSSSILKELSDMQIKETLSIFSSTLKIDKSSTLYIPFLYSEKSNSFVIFIQSLVVV